jgi:hypothetical protein
MQPCDCVRELQRGKAFQTLKPEPLTRGSPLGISTHLQHRSYPVGSRSNMLARGSFKVLQISNKRDALTRFVPLSYFWIC